MKTNPSYRSCHAWLLAAVLAPVLFCHAQTSAPAPGGSESVGIIDFEGAPVQAVLDYYARLTKRSIIAAPNLAGVIRFRSQTELTRAEALQALDSVLAINGISVIPMGEKFLKVVQSPAAKQEGIRITTGDAVDLPSSDALLAQVVRVRHAELAEVTSAIQPLLHAYGQVVQLPQSNSILVIDTANNVNQMLELLKHVDQPYELRLESKVYQLQYAKAAEAVQRIQTILQSAQQFQPKAGAAAARPAPAPGAPPMPGAPPAPGAAAIETKTILAPDERTNKIFVFSRSKDFTLLDKIIAEMDIKVEPDVITKVFELNYANADEAAALVNAIIGSSSGYTGVSSRRSTRSGTSSTGASATRTAAPAPVPSVPTVRTAGGSEPTAFLEYPDGVRVLPDNRTNTLLIMATKDDMERLFKLVQSIDVNVPQVLIEVIIGEVTLASGTDTGVDIVNRVIKAGSSHLYGGTMTGDSSGPKPLNIGAAAIGTTPAGAALSSALTYWATFRSLNLDAVVRLMATTGRLKVLSTPVIQTLHNQEGSITVGDSVPVATSTLSDVLYGGSTNQVTSGLRANVEYKDVALELRVTPRINPDGFVTLEIAQKVNELGPEKNIGGISVPSIQKREAQSVVMVKDQSTVVLGGLIKEKKNRSQTKVPVLGDIPFLGWLFKSQQTNDERNELIVFIRPVVLRNELHTTGEAGRRLQMMESGKELDLKKRIENSPDTNAPPVTVTPPTEETKPEPRRGATPSNLKLGGKKNE
ncbi:MAG: type II secretion system protein GspD [Verrucomicrobia bacterium]|nr:type II secretion system protein GspD [Verrucomicrobiota bacterium]